MRRVFTTKRLAFLFVMMLFCVATASAATDPHESYFNRHCLAIHPLPAGAPTLTITCNSQAICYIYPKTVETIANIQSPTIRHLVVATLLACKVSGQKLAGFNDYQLGPKGLNIKQD